MKIKKVFARSLAGIMAACMFVLSGGGVVSAVGDVEYSVCNSVGSQQAQLIIDTINGNSSETATISPSSILCIFGHSIAEGRAIETQHRVWATAPRCRQITYRVNYCTRSSCNYVTYTVISDSRIPCCA